MVQPVWHHLFPGGDHAAGELYQTSLMSALLQGIYEGETTFAELARHGDFGLGTFNDLDGEMIALDGKFYQLRSDGTARPVAPEQKTPFAVVTWFEPDTEVDIQSPTEKQQLLSLIEHHTDSNLFYALRIDGVFENLRTRTVSRQQKPYPPLQEAAAHEAINTFAGVKGTLAGFRTPAYAQGIGVAGFHLHFLRDDRQAGGHALDYTLQQGKVQLATLHGFHIELPTSGDFLKADLEDASASEKIKSTEG